MFTGIIEAVGILTKKDRSGGGARLGISTPQSFKLKERVKVGDSIAANGVCLTAAAVMDDMYLADASFETMAKTAFSTYQKGHRLNLELALRPCDHLGGHIVQGHVDGVGQVIKKDKQGDSFNIFIRAPFDLLPYIAMKGSIAVDGTSLTVNGIDNDIFRITIIPHTTKVLAFENWTAGAQVNLEVDILARHIERLMQFKLEKPQSQDHTGGGISYDTLLKNGLI